MNTLFLYLVVNNLTIIIPCKPQKGKISKQLMEKGVQLVKYNLWKNTLDVITWFGDIHPPPPSSTKNKTHLHIHPLHIPYIMWFLSIRYQRESIRFHFPLHRNHDLWKDDYQAHKKITLWSNNIAWRKIRSDFGVTMGSFDGAGPS